MNKPEQGCKTSTHTISQTERVEDWVDVDTSDDAFLGERIQALQPKHGYRAGGDAVMLAAAVPVGGGSGECVLDVGAGVGVVSLCLAARINDVQVTLIEREGILCALAVKNLQRNGWQARGDVIEGDLTGPALELVEKGLVLEKFDHVVANPPYFTQGRSTAAPDGTRARSRAMPAGAFERWAKFLAAAARPGGSATIIYQAEGLSEVLDGLSRRFGSLRILPIHSRESEVAHRIIVQGIKGSRGPLKILPGFIMHDRENEFTDRAARILRSGAGLQML